MFGCELSSSITSTQPVPGSNPLYFIELALLGKLEDKV